MDRCESLAITRDERRTVVNATHARRALASAAESAAGPALASAPVAMLSDSIWTTRFGADPSVVGSGIEMDGARISLGALGFAVATLPWCGNQRDAEALDGVDGFRRRQALRHDEPTLACRLEELDRVAVGIFELNLSTTRAGFHRITERQPRFLEPLNLTSDVSHTQHDAIPSAGFLTPPVGHRPRA
jgi:hypothetical protein